MKLVVLYLLIIFIFLIFFIKHITSLSETFSTKLTCYDIFGIDKCDDLVTDDAPFNCNGTASLSTCTVGGSGSNRGGKIEINQTTFLPNSGINVSCDFWITNNVNSTRYIWYHNGTSWYTIYENISNYTTSDFRNVSISFKLNSSTGEQRIRCAITCVVGSTNPVTLDNGDFCLNTTDSTTRFDNDDVNFTVTDYPKYSNWNLINATTGETILDGTHLTRNNLINASAEWDKEIYNANISHNGTGSFKNYTICIHPDCNEWTNYT